MSEKERLEEAAALVLERKRKAEELAAIDRRLEMVLIPSTGEKRKKPVLSGKEWEKALGASVCFNPQSTPSID